MRERVIETPCGPTLVHELGEGKPVFVIHGGPGFEYKYMVPALRPLANKRRLIFYDQPGCGQTQTPTTKVTPLQTFEHFRTLSYQLSNGQPAGVVAHSWGALVFIASLVDKRLQHQPVAEFNEGVLINPVPTSAKVYRRSAQTLLKRMSLKDRLRLFYTAITKSEGEHLMKILLPYYVAEKKSLPDKKFNLNKSTYLQLSKQLSTFDYSDTINQLPKLTIVRGCQDFITRDLVNDLIGHMPKCHELENVGHFPFWEAPDRFNSCLDEAFR